MTTTVALAGLVVALTAMPSAAQGTSGRDGGRGTALSITRSAPSQPYAAQVAIGRGQADVHLLMTWAATTLPWSAAEYSTAKRAIVLTTARSSRADVEAFLSGPFAAKTPVRVHYGDDPITVDFLM